MKLSFNFTSIPQRNTHFSKSYQSITLPCRGCYSLQNFCPPYFREQTYSYCIGKHRHQFRTLRRKISHSLCNPKIHCRLNCTDIQSKNTRRLVSLNSHTKPNPREEARIKRNGFSFSHSRKVVPKYPWRQVEHIGSKADHRSLLSILLM